MMRNLICFFIVAVSCCGSVYSVNFQDALDFSDKSMELIHKCAIDVNKSESSTDMRSLSETEGKYKDFDEFVVFSFPREVFDTPVEEVAKFVREKFSNRSPVFTGYHQGANYVAKVVNLLSNSSDFERNQIKLITFCPADRISESFDGLSLTNRLNFSHAFEKVDFYRSNMLEIPIFRIAEIISRINRKDIVAQCAGWGMVGLSRYIENHSVLFFVAGVGLIGADSWQISRRKSLYLPVSGVCKAFRRAVNRARGAIFEYQVRESGIRLGD